MGQCRSKLSELLPAQSHRKKMGGGAGYAMDDSVSDLGGGRGLLSSSEAGSVGGSFRGSVPPKQRSGKGKLFDYYGGSIDEDIPEEDEAKASY